MPSRIREIKEYVKKIKERFKPKQVILFGSYASGKPSKDSDIDLLVIMETKLRSPEQAILIRKELPSIFPLDLIVRKPQEIRKRANQGDFFLRMILEKGIIL